MTDKSHRARISLAGEPYTAKVAGVTVARSEHAMILQEEKAGKRYPPVVYFPREDIAAESLQPTDHHSHCPIKGEAGYFDVTVDGNVLENAAWTYPDPLPMVRAVKGYVAFYPDKVTIEKA
jgi:putative cofactor-binding repeat protein